MKVTIKIVLQQSIVIALLPLPLGADQPLDLLGDLVGLARRGDKANGEKPWQAPGDHGLDTSDAIKLNHNARTQLARLWAAQQRAFGRDVDAIAFEL